MSNPTVNSFKTMTVADFKRVAANKTALSKQAKAESKAAEKKAGEATRKPIFGPTAERMIKLGADPLNNLQNLIAEAVKHALIEHRALPDTQWQWHERFGVAMRRVNGPTASPSAAKIMATLSACEPVARPLVPKGFRMEYNYSPSQGDPDQLAYTVMAAFLPDTETYRTAFRAATKLVYLGPPLSNMTKKTGAVLTDLSKTRKFPELPATKEWINKYGTASYADLLEAEVRKLWDCNIPESAFTFPKIIGKAKGEDGKLSGAWVDQVIANVSTWLLVDGDPDHEGNFADSAPLIMKATSPGMPWVLSKPEGAASWGNAHSKELLDAFCYAPSLGFSSKSSTLYRFLHLLLTDAHFGVLALRQKAFKVDKDGVPRATSAEAAQYFASKSGSRAYHSIYKSDRGVHPDTAGLREGNIYDFRMHIVNLAMAGNIKPIERSEIAEGKPDRTVWSSSLLCRVLGGRIGHLTYQHFNSPNKYRPGFMRGGTEKLVADVCKELGLDPDGATLLPDKDTPTLCRAEWEGALWSFPDVKAMDLSVDEIDKKVATDAMFTNLPMDHRRIETMLLAAVFGFFQACLMQPEGLTNSGVFYYPKDINLSGNNYTYLINQVRSLRVTLGLNGKLPNQKTTLQRELPNCKFVHRSVGDDQLIGLWTPPMTTAAGETVYANSRNASGTMNGNAKYRFDIVKKAYESVLDEINLALAPGLDSRAGAFKTDTKDLLTSISDGAFLSHHIQWTTMHGGAWIAHRPLTKLIFTPIWPRRAIKDWDSTGITPAGLTALRAFATALEAGVAFPGLNNACQQVFSEAGRRSGQLSLADPAYHAAFNESFSDPSAIGEDVFETSPYAILEGIAESIGEDFLPTSWPTESFIWALHTGKELEPELLESSEDTSVPPSEQLEIDDLGDSESPREANASADSVHAQSALELSEVASDLDDL